MIHSEAIQTSNIQMQIHTKSQRPFDTLESHTNLKVVEYFFQPEFNLSKESQRAKGILMSHSGHDLRRRTITKLTSQDVLETECRLYFVLKLQHVRVWRCSTMPLGRIPQNRL